MAQMQTLSIAIDESKAGTRLDSFVAAHIPSCSRSYAASLISQGEITVGDAIRKPGYRIKAGDRVSVAIPPPQPIEALPEPIDLDVIYEDGSLIVINKPPGLVVHPAPGHTRGTLVNGLLYHCPDLKGIGGDIRPGIVHRLDKDTSGLIVVAKEPLALNDLADQFRYREVKKAYLAVVQGEVAQDTGEVNLPIARHPVDRKRMSAVHEGSKRSAGAGRLRKAETAWTVRERYGDATLLLLYPRTGRTHQIRVHCAAIEHPIIGDPVYGRSRGKASRERISADRQMLHAWRISFLHPASGIRMDLEAPIPQDMERLIGRLSGRN